MMPEWHQLVCMSGHVKESETAKMLQLYATSIFQGHSFVCQLDYSAICTQTDLATWETSVTRNVGVEDMV